MPPSQFKPIVNNCLGPGRISVGNLHWCVSCVLLVAAAYVTQAQSRDPRVVAEGPSCIQCSVDTATRVILGRGPNEGTLIGRPQVVFEDGQQRFWVVGESEPPQVYDHSGKFLANIGRKGRGPGELGRPAGAILLPGDSTLVFDGLGPRGIVVAPDLTIRRSVRMLGNLGRGLVLQWPTEVVMNGIVATPQSAGWPLHELRFGGDQANLVRSFGPGGGELASGPTAWQQSQVLARARGGGFWTGSQFVYEFRKWRSPGDEQESYRRSPGWFTGRVKPWLGDLTTPPPPAMAGIQEDRDGLLWIFVRVPARNWREGWSRVPAGAKEVLARDVLLEKLFDTMIEVVDPTAGVVVARRQLNQYLVDLPGAGQAAFYEEQNDQPVVRVMSLSLRRR
jgi:hypothetical protein